MEMLITGVTSQMQGVGRALDGRAVFVPGALPGERVEARPIREKARLIEATLERVLEPSPHRVRPPCPYVGVCGGCAAMHMDYQTSLILKGERVSEALRRLGGVEGAGVLPVIGMEVPFRARNKAEYAIEGGHIGLRREGSRQIVEVEDCLVQGQRSVSAMGVVRKWLREAGPFSGYLVTRLTRAGELMCVVAAGSRPRGLEELGERLFAGVEGMKSFYFCHLKPHPVHALDGQCQWLRGERALTDTLMGLSFRLQPQSFFQVNPLQAELLYEAVLRMAGLTGRERVLDAYCGAGTITLCMARQAHSALGVEIVPQAVDDARENARLNGLLDRAKFACADAALALPRLLKQDQPPQVVVLDPPRKGVDPNLTDALVQARVPRIVYVSCDPATLARDVKRLQGAYRLQAVQPVDMFPWAGHVETVVLMSRVEK